MGRSSHEPRRRRWRALLIVGAGLAVVGGLGARHWLRAHGLTAGELVSELRQDSPRHDWVSIEKKHWQALSGSEGEPPEVTDAREGNSAGCPVGMVRVKGAFRSERGGLATGQVERLQDSACTDWISREFPARCRTYDREKIAGEVETLPTQAMDYCVDRFEYPNILGQNPMIVASFHEADAICKEASKRLCTENEWTFACEGEEARPYPYGWTRDDTACVIDRPWRPFNQGALSPRDGQKAREELDRLWQGEPSGSRAGCKSPFGVYDMTGNVDEWTRSVNPTGYTSILKGGYWGPVRARCRPATRAHREDFVAYQQSFRCCAESDDETALAPAPSDAGSPALPIAAPASPSFIDAGAARPTANLDVEWLAAGDGEDELAAITKARAAFCSAWASAGGRAGARSAWASAALIALAMLRRRSPSMTADVLSRRRRGPSRGPGR